MSSEDATKRLSSKKQTLDDAYAAPANFLEIDVINPITHGIGGKRWVSSDAESNTRSKVLWDDINILRELIGHLISIFCDEWNSIRRN